MDFTFGFGGGSAKQRIPLSEALRRYSDAQMRRIKRLAFDDYADANERSTLVRAIETAEELHQVALWYNYDGFEVSELREIIDHPLCAKGTALMIYWGLQPYYLYRQQEKKKTLPPELQKTLPLLKNIERRVFEGLFGDSPIAFSTFNILGRPLSDDDAYKPGIRLVPVWMKVDIAGKTLERQKIEET